MQPGNPVVMRCFCSFMVLVVGLLVVSGSGEHSARSAIHVLIIDIFLVFVWEERKKIRGEDLNCTTIIML